jgi:hypothetical protein
MPNPPANITGVTNPNPTGDPSYNLTGGQSQTLGQDREEDDELRDRILKGASIGGAATVRAVRDKIRALEGSPSLTIYTNRTTTDNANGNGLPELSSELVIHAPSVTNEDIAQAIHEVIAVTENQKNGINGTAVSDTIVDDVLWQDRVIKWSEPIEVSLTITLDLVTQDGYIGDEDVKEVVAEYIGGTLPDGSPTAGLDVSKDVIVDEIERRVNTLEGIIGTATITIDTDGDGNDNITTRSDGLRVIEIASNEVSTVDATTDITVNEQ